MPDHSKERIKVREERSMIKTLTKEEFIKRFLKDQNRRAWAKERLVDDYIIGRAVERYSNEAKIRSRGRNYNTYRTHR